jgi:hypothetical protein
VGVADELPDVERLIERDRVECGASRCGQESERHEDAKGGPGDGLVTHDVLLCSKRALLTVPTPTALGL